MDTRMLFWIQSEETTFSSEEAKVPHAPLWSPREHMTKHYSVVYCDAFI